VQPVQKVLTSGLEKGTLPFIANVQAPVLQIRDLIDGTHWLITRIF
jgi:hypothetical protein